MASDIRLTVSDRAGRPTACSGSVWEPKMGYARAVRCGNYIVVSGTVGVNADGTYPEELADQTRRSLHIIQCAIEALGGKIENVIRTRIYVVDIAQWQEVAAVHGEIFREIRPATAMVQVAQLIDEQALVEIEAEAIVPGERS